MTTLDIAAIIIEPDGTVTQAMAEPGNSGETVTSSRKMAQWYLDLLLTQQGSVPYDTRGCTFVQALRFGRMQSELDVFTAFSAAQIQLGPQMRRLKTAKDPLSEQFKKAKLSQVTVVDGRVDLTIEVVSNSGITTTIKLPLVFEIS